MRNYTDDKWTYASERMDANFPFSTYSDARLAELCFDDEVPNTVLQRVLRVFPEFMLELEDVTFESVWDIPRHVSDLRKENALKRSVVVNPFAAIGHSDVATRGNPVPLIVLDLVVDWMMYMRGSMGAAASLEQWWEDKVNHYNNRFHQMSLVHRSWTPIAQRGLRNRARIRCNKIENFLFNPFCGPEVTEMTIFWTFDDGRSFPTENDLWLLDELFRRTPNVQSLAFNASISILCHDNLHHSLELGSCFEIIAKRLSCLENLLLRHQCDRPSVDNFQLPIYYPGLPALCAHLPKMVSLKRLSIHGLKGDSPVDWNTHPPAQLKAVELDCVQPTDEQNIKWLLNPRGEFSLTSLCVSISDEYYTECSKQITIPKDCLSTTKRLTLYVRNVGVLEHTLREWCENLLGQCEELISLDVVVKCQCDFMKDLSLPPSLERLSVHYFFNLYDSWVHQFFELDPAGQQLAELLQRNLPRLPRLRTLLVTTQSRTWYRDERDIAGNALPRHILELCRDHGVEVIR